MFRLKAENCLSILERVKKELEYNFVQLFNYYNILNSYNIIGQFFLYHLLYASFSSFKTGYIYGKQYKPYG